MGRPRAPRRVHTVRSTQQHDLLERLAAAHDTAARPCHPLLSSLSFHSSTLPMFLAPPVLFLSRVPRAACLGARSAPAQRNKAPKATHTSHTPPHAINTASFAEFENARLHAPRTPLWALVFTLGCGRLGSPRHPAPLFVPHLAFTVQPSFLCKRWAVHSLAPEVQSNNRQGSEEQGCTCSRKLDGCNA